MKETLETERLFLRQLRDEDAVALSKYGSNFDIARMTGSFPHPFPLLSAEFKILHLRAQNRRNLAYPYAITEKGNDSMIGIVDLFRRTETDNLEFGYWIGEPFWGKGYASEACRALMGEADRHFGSSPLKAGVFSDNPASVRVLEKLGFRLTGKKEQYFSMARLKKAESVLLERPARPAATLSESASHSSLVIEAE